MRLQFGSLHIWQLHFCCGPFGLSFPRLQTVDLYHVRSVPQQIWRLRNNVLESEENEVVQMQKGLKAAKKKSSELELS